MRNLVISILVLATAIASIGSRPGYACPGAENGFCSTTATDGRSTTETPEDVASLNVLRLPRIETLTAQSDYAMFMKPGVPEDIQRRALRRLWLSDPIFAYRDGLDNYDDDYAWPGDRDEPHNLNSIAQAPAR